MMSQTHLLVASALFTRPGMKLRNTAVLVGAFVPDAAIYALFIWSKIQAIPQSTVWDKLYWQEPWQTYTAAGNSLPLYLIVGFLGLVALRNASGLFRIGLFLTFFALAAVTHIAGDLPVHVADAHRHFWPLSDWKFISPVSYWNSDHHGRAFMVFETLLGAFLAIILFRRFQNRWVRTLLALLIAAYIAVPTYFSLQLGSA